ncbi:MAG: ribosomal RNA small subunit methyltransferase A [Candidatus Yanofskybacteria bacterium]|nr:ribosomal RNA small subunit methyltransferase A [Candidatus Yanofskybacteria bacterium]
MKKLSNIKPKKSLGQNFLINQGILDKIIGTAEVGPEDTVVEIGPGTGNLTRKLSEKAKRIIAVEKDRRLIEELKDKFHNSNVKIVEGDILKLDIKKLFENCKLKIENCDYKVIGNIPYYITSNFLRTVFEKWPKPKLIVLTVQKEVAQRIVAKPPHMNLLALSVQFYSSPTIIGYVSKGSFRPIPKVDSAIIRIVPKKDMPTDKDLFFKIIKAGFSGKRKQLKNTLVRIFASKEKTVEILNELRVNPDSRPEELSVESWLKLTTLISTS